MAQVVQTNLSPTIIDLGDGTYLPVVELEAASGSPVVQSFQVPLIIDNGDGTFTPVLRSAS